MFKRSTLEERMAAARSLYPIGTKVLYRPVAGLPEQVPTTIRSAPWALGHGEIVIAVEARAGGVAVSHLSLAEGGVR